MSSCQLATHFTCHCSKCVGCFNSTTSVVVEDYQQQQEQKQDQLPSSSSASSSHEDLFFFYQQQQQEQQSSITTTIRSVSVGASSSSSSSSQQQNSNTLLEDCQSFSNLINMNFEEEEEEKKQQQQQQQQQQEQEITLVAAVQKEEEENKNANIKVKVNKTTKKEKQPKKVNQQPKTYLDIARSLQNSSKTFNNKPKHYIFAFEIPPMYVALQRQYSWYPLPSYLQNEEAFQAHMFDMIYRERREKRRTLRRLNRRQYLPNWCYELNQNSSRSIREMVVKKATSSSVAVTYDRRLIESHYRLPRSTAIAHIRKNRWICRFRIFNSRKPFSHMGHYDFASGSGYSKPDTRGEDNFETRCKYHNKDGKFKYNRNGGYTRNARRNNGYDKKSKQTYMGNSQKTMHGKPWLHTRQKKLFKGERRLQEFFGTL